MNLKAKLINNIDIGNVLKLSDIFDIAKNGLKIDDYKNIIEFYDEDNNIVGFVNFIESVYLEYTKTYIKSIHFIDINYLDQIIKKMINVMKKKYIYTYLDSENKSYDDNIINILKLNNFIGDDFLFLNLQ
jgi:hypothetical protein